MDYMAGTVAATAPAPPKPRRPHRPRKDYTNLDTVFDSLDSLKTALRQYMDNAMTQDALPEYVSCAMTLSTHAALPLKSPAEGPYAEGGPSYLPFDGYSNHLDLTPHDAQGHEHYGPVEQEQQMIYKPVLDLVNIDDLKQRQMWQRAAAKGIVHQLQDLDGFKYCFNNNWSSKDDNGYRYSYTCLDSLENKDRHANGFRATNAATRRPGANTRGVRKPTYDCKGQIAVKFSGLRQSVEVVYKHHAIHKTVAERRPPPRKDSKRKSITLQQDDADAEPDTSLLSFDDPSAHDTSFLLDDVDSTNFHTYPDPIELPPVTKPPKKTNQTRTKRPKTQSTQSVEQQDRGLSLKEILQQSMSASGNSPTARAPPRQPSPPPPPALAPTPTLWPPPTAVYTTPPAHTFVGHNLASATQQNFASSNSQPDVGRFSKLAVPCFKCKAAQTQCDGKQPICNSCQIRGTVCNYPSILRFDKTPTSDSRWIQVQPAQQGRGVFRLNPTPPSAPAATAQANDIFNNNFQGSWYPQS